jgi:hypothetical protein
MHYRRIDMRVAGSTSTWERTMMKIRFNPGRALGAALLSAATAALATTALAADHGPVAQHRPPSHGPWRGDIHRFHEHDWGVWRGGHWTHGPHNGRLGWWWVTGGLWYFYPAPVYPYPSPWEPPPVELVSPPAGSAPPPPPTQYWYYCAASQSYYPYVATCPGGWQQVPSTPGPSAEPPR